MDLLPAIAYVAATSGVVLTAGLSARLLGFDSTAVSWLSTMVLASAFVVGLEIALGIVGGLRPANLLVVSVVTSIVAVGCTVQRVGMTELRAELRDDFGKLYDVLTQSRLSIILTSLVVGKLVWLLFIVVLLPPRSWDGLAYHLPPMIEYMQEARITLVGYSIFANAYPNNVELHFLWNVIFLRDDVLVDGTQMAFGLMGMMAVYVLADEVGFDSENAFLASVAFFSTPTVLLQSVVTYVDLAFGAMVLASYAFLVCYWKRGEFRHVLLLGFSAGLLVGTKYTGALFFLVLFAGLSVALLSHESTATKEKIAYHLAVFLVASASLGSFWYFRNVLVFGNPVYPFSVELLGYTVFEGSMTVHEKVVHAWGHVENVHGGYGTTSTLEKVYLSWFEKSRIYSKGRPVGGYGPQWAILALPSLVLFSYSSVKRKDKTNILLLLLFLVPLVLTVEPWKARYNIYLIGIGAIALGFVRKEVLRASKKPVTVLIVIVLVFSLVMSSAHNPYKYDGQIERAMSVPPEERTSMNVRGLSPLTWENYTAIIPTGSNVGFVLENRALPYTLYDKRFQNEITYVGNREGPNRFVRYVRANNLDYIVLPKESEEAKWAQNEETLRKLFDNDEYNVYRVEGR